MEHKYTNRNHPYKVGVMEKHRLNIKKAECEANFDSEDDRRECYSKVKQQSLRG